MKFSAYTIWLLIVIWFAGCGVMGLLQQRGHDMAGYGIMWGICFGLPLFLIGLPASIILFIIGVAADRRTRREQQVLKLRDTND